jgi:RNA polymerase sigma factor (TIGR02999 family)
MSDVTRILSQIKQGDPQAAEKLLPLVYEELRKLAMVKLAQEKAGQTLQGTALVHEAYVRLIEADGQAWDSRGHFFSAAAEAMRRILVESARRKQRLKNGGNLCRHDIDHCDIAAPAASHNILELDEALDRLQNEDRQAAELVKLRYFSGLTIQDAAAVLEISPRKADFLWSFARAWLRREIES